MSRQRKAPVELPRLSYSLDEVAQMHGLAPNTIRAAIIAQQVPARRVGTRILIDRDTALHLGNPVAPGDL